MIKLTALLKRNTQLTSEQFQEHWRTTHADLIRTTPAMTEHVVKYVQRPAFSETGHWAGTQGYDGIAEQWFDSMAEFEAMIADATYLERVRPDETVLLDLPNCVFLITEEPRVVIDGTAT